MTTSTELMCVWTFTADFGRMGALHGVFLATPGQVKEVIGKELYLGEVLGKHSEVALVIDETMIKLFTDDVMQVQGIAACAYPFTTIVGYNPVDMYEDMKTEAMILTAACTEDD